MLRIAQCKLEVGHSEDALTQKIRKMLCLKANDHLSYSVFRRSLDARKKPSLFYVYTINCEVDHEETVLKRASKNGVIRLNEQVYKFPHPGKMRLSHRPIIVGTGPAGLFCGYFLAKNGYRPILLERGKDVDSRMKDVEHFWATGRLDPSSNVQFGEGGAGTFSDGKLNTLVKDKDGRGREVLRVFQEAGAPGDILVDAKPHVGTDILCKVVKTMREEIIRCGGEVLFESQLVDISIKDGALSEIVVSKRTSEQNVVIPCNCLVLAIGHSARDTFSMLDAHGFPMQAKDFAVGFRVEHPQETIDLAQYGQKRGDLLPAAAYKVTFQASNGRSVYSFCMCPGGYVVNASSEPGRLAVNGMSYSGRDGVHANSAIIMSVTRADYPDDSPLAGVSFQRELEEKAYHAGGGKVPVMTLSSFKAHFHGNAFPIDENVPSPCIKGQYCFSDITKILPDTLNEAFLEGMEHFNKLIPGFSEEHVLIEAVESRTSSPVRIMRDGMTLESEMRGIYPCGEGAGYAGGIMSAAMDGMRVAEAIAAKYAPFEDET
ncbi:MAG: NAD(P)-binding protein [Lachnospiraceae bacterium]|nr:NAD(P)-binding protein [Lachnospiraceae bacterium]